MTKDEVVTILVPALKNVFNKDYVSIQDAIDFEKLHGLDEYTNNYQRSDDRPMPDDIRYFYMALAGPYHKAFLKAYKIRKGIK